MYKLIIVDDEKLELKLLSKMLDWDSYGFNLIGTFSSTSSVIDFVLKNKVDLVITDIRMPGRDGIELASALKNISPKTLTIFISAYTDFEYARNAIRLSVVDYVLKPIVVENVVSAINKAKNLLDSNLNDEDISDLPLLPAQQAVFEYFADNSSFDKFIQSLKICGFTDISFDSCAATFKITIDDFSGYLKNNWKYGADKAYYAILNLISCDEFYYIPVNYMFDTINVIAISKIGTFGEFEKSLNSTLAEMCESAETILEVSIKTEIISIGKNILAELEKARNVLNFPKTESNSELSDSTAIQRAINYINANYHRDITLTEIANYVYLSPYHFSRIFKVKTGEKYIDYLSRVRIEKAKELLSQSEMKITDICVKVGYNSKTHFHKMFKLYTGVTPQEYRNSNLKE